MKQSLAPLHRISPICPNATAHAYAIRRVQYMYVSGVMMMISILITETTGSLCVWIKNLPLFRLECAFISAGVQFVICCAFVLYQSALDFFFFFFFYLLIFADLWLHLSASMLLCAAICGFRVRIFALFYNCGGLQFVQRLFELIGKGRFCRFVFDWKPANSTTAFKLHLLNGFRFWF